MFTSFVLFTEQLLFCNTIFQDTGPEQKYSSAVRFLFTMFQDCCKRGILGSAPSQSFGQYPLLDFGFGGPQNIAFQPISFSPHPFFFKSFFFFQKKKIGLTNYKSDFFLSMILKYNTICVLKSCIRGGLKITQGEEAAYFISFINRAIVFYQTTAQNLFLCK